MKKSFLLGLITLVVLGHSHAAESRTFTGIVAFGDSLSDNGNFMPYPPAFPGTTAYPQATWVKQLAGKFNITQFECVGQGKVAAGTNYAFGGAATKATVDKGLGYGSPFNEHNLTAQISGRYLNSKFNPAGPQTHALHTITIGGNDLLSASARMDQIGSGWSTLDTVAVDAAKSVETQITALAKAGVTHVLWASLSNYAKMPFALQIGKNFGAHSNAYLTAITSAAKAYNAEMDQAIARLKTDPATARVTVYKLDLYGSIEDVQARPEHYGFVNVKDKLTAIPMLGWGGGNPDGKVDEYLFLDELHPSFKGHALIADQAYKLVSAQ